MNSELSAEELLVANQSVREKAFWLEQLGSCEEPTMIDYDLSGSAAVQTGIFSWQARPDTARALLDMSKGRNEGLRVILFAATALFVHKYTSRKDLVIGMPALTDTVANNQLLPLVFHIDPAKSFKQCILGTKAILAQANAHRHFPLRAIQRLLNPAAKTSWSDIGMTLEDIQDESMLYTGDTNLFFAFSRAGRQLSCQVYYNTARYMPATIEQLATLFEAFLAALAAGIDTPVQLVPLKAALHPAKESAQPERPDLAAGKAIPDLFRNQANEKMHHTAISCENDAISYSELDKRSDKLAARLITVHQLRPGAVVALVLERSIDAVVAMLAVLKARCAYLHAEAGTPAERLEYMLQDSAAALVITHRHSRSGWSGCPVAVELIDEMNDWPDVAFYPERVLPTDIAYIVYTSGSTGKPKGVAVEHQSCLNLVFAMNEAIIGAYGEAQIMGLVSPFIFDACVQLVFGALLFGHQLRILTNAERSDGKALQESYTRYQVTISDGTPSHINLLIQAWSRQTFRQNLRHFISGGEALHASRILEFYRLQEGQQPPVLTNVYGPTECTVNATYYPVPVDTGSLPAVVPIGKALINYRIYILDEQEQPCAAGQPGQLCIAGKGLMRGYLNRPELTAAVVKHIDAVNDTVYLTGDRVKLSEDGNIQFIGRMDNQVKIRGHRIELSEIETVIAAHPQVSQTVVTIRHDQGDNAFLAAYYESASLQPAALRDHLSQKLPQYMLPASLNRLDAFEYLPNKKINRSALPEPSFAESSDGDDAPANATEEKLLELWQASLLLPGASIGVNDNYFNIGGDSIKTISLLYDINETFGSGFSIVDLYRYDTIRKFAQVIAKKQPVTGESSMLLEAEAEMDRVRDAFMSRLS